MKAMTKLTHLRVLALIGALALAVGLLVLTGSKPAQAAFPGGNGKIAFTFEPSLTDPNCFCDRTDADQDIYTINSDGTGRTPLTNDVDVANDLFPAFSADGAKIAFNRTDPTGGQIQIYTMNADGTGATPIPNTDGGFKPTWSPKGTKIAFSKEGNIWVVNAADGSGLTKLTNDGGAEPAWSPNGELIAFVSARNGGFQDIYVMSATGARQTKVTKSQNVGGPNWSPDGKKLVFYGGFLGDSHSEIYVLDMIGFPGKSKLTKLTDTPEESLYQHKLTPAWSPDGKKITYALTDLTDPDYPLGPGSGTQFDLYMMNADGSGNTNITNTLGGQLDERFPDWQPLK